MKKYYFIITITFVNLLLSCNDEAGYVSRPIFDIHKKYIGDSIFVNHAIMKIIFIDTSYEIDSIVFSRYDNSSKSLKSIKTFKGGNNIFENIDYYENGNIKQYSFIDEDNGNYYYERQYHDSGPLIKIRGNIFFQGYIVDTVSKNLDVKVGSTVDYRIYYPNPPDCNVKIYIKNEDGTVYDVFGKSNFLNFMQTVYKDNNKLGNFKVTVLLELKDNSMDTTINYSHSFVYKVIP
jgi:hypothetical protein